MSREAREAFKKRRSRQKEFAMKKPVKKSKLSWKPVRKGARYCASKCGFGCTYKKYKAVKKKAEALAKKLGPGWSAHVGESFIDWVGQVSHPQLGEIHLPHRNRSQFWLSALAESPQHDCMRQFCAGGTPKQLLEALEKHLDEVSGINAEATFVAREGLRRLAE